MTISPNKDFLEIFNKTLRKEIDIKDKDINDAMFSMLTKSNIKNFNEYIRIFQYRKKSNMEHLINQYKHLKYNYKHKGDLLGHSGQIERIAFDNTGKHVFSGGTDGMIKVWDITTGYLIHTFIGHRNMINDLCFSKDGKYFISCDFNGIINIWNLETLKIHLSIKLFTGVAFVEFFEIQDINNLYNFVVILCNGLVKIYSFDKDKLIKESENDFTLDEPYKAICITDGGRFLLRAGYWPYLILLDTLNIDKCIVFDTNNLPVQTICAAKDCLKFAAGCGNWLFQWTYFYEGNSSMGNFNRSKKILPGHWKKSVVKLDPEDNFSIDNMCFLKNFYIICVCTDLKIRIYSDRLLRYTLEIEEMGSICAHPFENLFVFYGQHLSFYFLDKLISKKQINFSINDCQFSNDGEYFVIGDELGNVRTFSLNYDEYKYKEQFFISDFEHFTSLPNSLFRECRNENSLDSNRNLNTEWKRLPYFSRSVNNYTNILIENAGLLHFLSKYLDKVKYKRKYCDINIEIPINTCEIEESTESLDISDDSSSDAFSITENETKSSDEDLFIRRRGIHKEPQIVEQKAITLRRNYVEPKSIPRSGGVRLRRNDNNEDEGLEFFHYQKRRDKKKKKSSEGHLIKKLRRNSGKVEVDTQTLYMPKIRLRRHMPSDE